MKGAIGNAFIMNMVITFIVIFYMLLIGSMAYSKAYRTKNYLLDGLVRTENIFNKEHKSDIPKKQNFIKNLKLNVDEYLAKTGYMLRSNRDSCPRMVNGITVNDEKNGYTFVDISRLNEEVGYYDYCVYMKKFDKGDSISNYSYNYTVLVFMKFDIPVLGQFIKIPITGETITFRNLINN